MAWPSPSRSTATRDSASSAWGRRTRTLTSLTEILTDDGSRVVVVQRFLPEVGDGNKRIFVLDGKPVAAVYRFPADGDFRIGNPSAPAPLTARDREICARLAPALARDGLRMVGLAVIGRYLIEVNVTSPGALKKADALLGWSLCRDLVDHFLVGGVRRSA
jgi:glutathione synthase